MYVVLTGLVVATYVAVVALLGRLFEPNGLPVALVATGVVAVVFQPLRERLQRAVNRLMYGQRNDPYTALSLLGRRLEAAIPAGQVLPQVTETVAQALRVPYAAIELRHGDTFEAAASHGRPSPIALQLPLVYQGDTIGRLVVAPRAPGEPFSAADIRLLEDLARGAGVAAFAVRLTSDLQRSREHLVVAREEERRRLRRDLHDGLGPTLAGIGLQIETVRGLVRDDPHSAEALLAKLKTETQAAIASIRTIAYNLRPPALDELGLVGALREEGARFTSNSRGLRISITAMDDLPALPAAVEVAAYRIALEAMTNAARHAGATSCVVRVVANDGLDVDVRDDGCGVLTRLPARCRRQLDARTRQRARRHIHHRGPRRGRNTSPGPPPAGHNMTDPIRVVIADDHPVFRDGLRGILASARDLEVVAEAATGEEAVEAAPSTNPRSS